MMKTMLVLLFSLNLMAAVIPQGNYKLDKIVCSNGEALKLGGKFMLYDVSLEVLETEMKMIALAKSAKWAPFKLECTQINIGKYSNLEDGKYEGSLALDFVECNAKLWENILVKQSFGVEGQGEFNYSFSDGKLVISNPDTITKYSCEKTGSYPIYHYNKI